MPQSEFKAAAFDSGRFNLHQHVSDDLRTSTLMVLVHGFCGNGYDTWGELPKLLFDEVGSPTMDVGVYDYRSGYRAIGRRHGNFEFWFKQLAGHIREVEHEYSDIILVGHSLGGILVEAVAKTCLESRAQERDETPSPLAALVVVAAPRAGSGWAVPMFERIVPEFEILRRLNSRSADLDEFFATHVERRNVATARPGIVVLPTYAVLGGGDKVVGQFSAAFGVPTRQRLYLDATHRSVVKPNQEDVQLIEWLHGVVAERLDVRKQAARQFEHTSKRLPSATADARAAIVTQFMSDPTGLRWEEAYNQARREATTTTVAVYDARDVSTEVDLLIAVHDAALVVAADPGVRATVLQARAERDLHPRLSVAICPVGEKYTVAEQTVRKWLEADPPVGSMYVSGARDAVALRGILARFLQLLIGRDPGRAIQGTIADQLPDVINNRCDDAEGSASR